MDKFAALTERVAKLEAKLKQTQALLDLLYQENEARLHESAEEDGVTLDNLLRVLTGRQATILSGVLESLSSQEIADLTSITANTIRTHLRYIYKKAEVSQRHELITKYAESWQHMEEEHFRRLTGGKAELLRFEPHSK